MLGLAGALAAPAIVRAQARKSVKVSVGRQPFAAGNSPVTQYMINNKTFEKAAAALGIDLTVDWRDYPSAIPMVEAFVSGNLDYGMWGNTPIVRMIAQQQPIVLLNVGEGRLRFVVGVRKDSPIRNLADLKGKTVGALLGGDPYNAFTQMLQFELGNGDPKAHGITMVNTPTQAQAATIPSGMDAAIVIHPAYLQANAAIGTTAIINSFGYTEAHYEGPAGKGAGHLLQSVKKAPVLSRRLLSASFVLDHEPERGEEQPRGDDGLRHRPSSRRSTNWRSSTRARSPIWSRRSGICRLHRARRSSTTRLLFKRGWCWPTEGDARRPFSRSPSTWLPGRSSRSRWRGAR